MPRGLREQLAVVGNNIKALERMLETLGYHLSGVKD
jgi:hypothetical protein